MSRHALAVTIDSRRGKMANIYEEAIKLWGVHKQIAKANEELGELIVAMSHYFFEGTITQDDVAEEIADVEIMCNQLRLLVGNDLVNDCKIEKLKKLRWRVENAKKMPYSDR